MSSKKLSQRGGPSSPVEYKYTNPEASVVDVVDTGYFALLNGIALGTEVYQRVGRQVNMHELDIRLGFTQQNGALNTQLCRYLIVYDKQPNGAAPTLATILDTSGAATAPLKQHSRDGMRRYEILADHTFQVNPNTLVDSYPQFHHKIRLNRPIQFNSSSTGTVASILTGSLYLVAIDQVPLGLINIKMSYSANLTYSDM